MSGLFSRGAGAARAIARTQAAEALAAQGFTKEGEAWVGQWTLPSDALVTLRVELPLNFPDALPDIFVQPAPDEQLAHVSPSGKICIAPDSGALLDCERPADIVAQSISMASAVLAESREPRHSLELAREFSVYWQDLTDLRIINLCPSNTPGGAIHVSRFGDKWLVAQSSKALVAWLDAVGGKPSEVQEGILVRLTALPNLTPPTATLTLRELLALIERQGEGGQIREFSAALAAHGLPALVLLVAPAPEGDQPVILGCIVPQPSGRVADEAHAGFRKGHLPNALMVARSKAVPIERPRVQRADAPYLIERGGGSPLLLTKGVIVAGCGSVGSFVSQALAGLGIGTINLVDHEIMSFDNVHRHVLGAVDVGHPKATALAIALRARYPHLVIRDYPMRIERFLDEHENVACTAEVIVFALGDETLERRLNRVLHRETTRLHVWVEPLGLGGHLLLSNKAIAGCYECLYRRDDEHGLVNMSSFVAPNQKFQRTIAGCAGTFTPFGVLDAAQAGLHAAREVAAHLLASHSAPGLFSWCVSKSEFIGAGYRLSKRGDRIREGEHVRVHDFAQLSCNVCGDAER